MIEICIEINIVPFFYMIIIFNNKIKYFIYKIKIQDEFNIIGDEILFNEEFNNYSYTATVIFILNNYQKLKF